MLLNPFEITLKCLFVRPKSFGASSLDPSSWLSRSTEESDAKLRLSPALIQLGGFLQWSSTVQSRPMPELSLWGSASWRLENEGKEITSFFPQASMRETIPSMVVGIRKRKYHTHTHNSPINNIARQKLFLQVRGWTFKGIMLRRSSRRSRAGCVFCGVCFPFLRLTFLAEVNYAELAGEGGEDDNDAPQESVPEPEESPKRKSRKSKKTKNDEDEEYQGAAAEPSSERKRSAAGKPKKQKKKAKNEDDEEDDEDDGEGGPALVDLFAVGPSLRFVAGATEATIYHIPKDVVGLIFSHVPGSAVVPLSSLSFY